MKRLSCAIGLTAAILTAACSGYTPTAASPNGASALLGTWTSVSSATSSAGTCANFQWTVTDISGLTGSGSFTATCYGSLQVTGTGTGTLSGAAIDWKVTGTATGSGAASCAIAASGSASLSNDGALVIPYTGTTCLGAVSGTQTIKKR